MRESTKSKLMKITSIGVPVLVGAGLVAIHELTGFAENMQNYQIAKIPLVKEYFGESMAQMQKILAYSSRYIVDTTLFGAGFVVSRTVFSMRDIYQMGKFKNMDKFKNNKS